MTHILTMISSDIPLSIGHLEKAEKFIEDKGIGLNGKPQWLDPHKAVDLPIQNAVTMEQMFALRALFDADHLDVLCVPVANRKKKLLLADMDATIVTTETLDELAAKAGIKDKIAVITTRAMNGELDFHEALKERVGLLKDLPVSALEETLEETLFCDGAEKMVQTMGDNGAKCVLVSGGFTFFTNAVAARAGFHHNHGNTLNHDGKVLSGTVGEPILDKNAKRAFLDEYRTSLNLSTEDTMAIGDGANDLPMLLAASLGIGYRPKPVLAENLLNVLKYSDLTGALYAQGYRDIC